MSRICENCAFWLQAALHKGSQGRWFCAEGHSVVTDAAECPDWRERKSPVDKLDDIVARTPAPVDIPGDELALAKVEIGQLKFEVARLEERLAEFRGCEECGSWWRVPQEGKECPTCAQCELEEELTAEAKTAREELQAVKDALLGATTYMDPTPVAMAKHLALVHGEALKANRLLGEECERAGFILASCLDADADTDLIDLAQQAEQKLRSPNAARELQQARAQLVELLERQASEKYWESCDQAEAHGELIGAVERIIELLPNDRTGGGS